MAPVVSRAGNTAGTATGREIVESSMATFDELPPRVREVLANSNLNWSSAEAAELLMFDYEEDELIERIRALDQREADAHYAVLASGQLFAD